MPITGLKKVAGMFFSLCCMKALVQRSYLPCPSDISVFPDLPRWETAVLSQRPCSPHLLLLLTNPRYSQAQKIQQLEHQYIKLEIDLELLHVLQFSKFKFSL